MRFVISLSLACLTTCALFFLMVNIINPSQAKVMLQSTTSIDFGRPPKESKIETRIRKLTKPKPLELKQVPEIQNQRPSKPNKPLRLSFELTRIGGNASLTPGIFDVGTSLSSGSSSVGAGSPLVMIQPLYPERARQNKVEGFVTLEFSLNETGRPVDIQIIEASPKGYFEKSARRAISRWKYPAQSDGHAGRRRVTLAFELSEDKRA